MRLDNLTGTGAKPIALGSVGTNTITISLVDYYAQTPIFEIKVSSADGSVHSASGTAGNVIRYQATKAGQYLDVLCRETIEE